MKEREILLFELNPFVNIIFIYCIEVIIIIIQVIVIIQVLHILQEDPVI